MLFHACLEVDFSHQIWDRYSKSQIRWYLKHSHLSSIMQPKSDGISGTLFNYAVAIKKFFVNSAFIINIMY